MFLDSPRGQALQRAVFHNSHDLMQRLTSEQFTKGLALPVDRVQVGARVQQGGHHVRFGRFIVGRCMQGKIVLIIPGLDVSPALQEEADDIGGGKLTNGVPPDG